MLLIWFSFAKTNAFALKILKNFNDYEAVHFFNKNNINLQLVE